MYWRYTFVFMYVCLCTISYILMYILLNVYLSISGYTLFVSARIPVHICTYHSQYACIPVSICMYPCLYLHVFLFVSASIPVHVCIYPTQYLNVYIRMELHVSRLYLNVYLFISVCACLCLHFQFNAHSANHQPSRPAKLQYRQTHTQPLTHPHSLCCVFLTPVHKCRCPVSAASATASVGVTARSCLLLHRFEKCCVLAKCEASHLPPSPSDWS